MSKGKAYLVTGASRGIGRATALALGAQGATVAVHHNRQPQLADDVARAVVEAGGQSFVLRADLTDPASPQRLVDELAQRLEVLQGNSHLDGLVLNAGAVIAGGIDDLTLEDFERTIALNLRAPLFLVKAAAPMLVDGARVVTVSAALTRWANPELIVQAAAKAALQDASRSLAVTLGARGIGVIDVAPGVTRTELASAWIAAPGVEAALTEQTALARLGEPDDVADAIVAMLSPQARWITGQVIDASGGWRR